MAIQGGDLDRVLSLARRIGQNCNSCHRDHQAVTAALLRSPDFSPLRLRDPAGGAVHIWTLSASDDGRSMAESVDGKWSRVGSERTMRALLARSMWKSRKERQ
jgi:hypothetical protein